MSGTYKTKLLIRMWRDVIARSTLQFTHRRIWYNNYRNIPWSLSLEGSIWSAKRNLYASLMHFIQQDVIKLWAPAADHKTVSPPHISMPASAGMKSPVPDIPVQGFIQIRIPLAGVGCVQCPYFTLGRSTQIRFNHTGNNLVKGEMYGWSYKTVALYTDIFVAANGCDSIRTLYFNW